MDMTIAFQRCINPACAAEFDLLRVLSKCPKCGNLLDADYDWGKMRLPDRIGRLGRVDEWPAGGLAAVSGVWRFGALLPFAPAGRRVSIGEGHTQLRVSPRAAAFAGIKSENFRLQYEGLNPSGSFKDNGMAGAFTHASLAGAKIAACASTGNTSASLAAFAAASGLMRAIIFIGDGKIAYGKLSQALDYGAVTLLVKGDFDDAMARVQEVCAGEGIYLVNSVNPFRLEGQKTTMYRILEGLDWRIPDWVVCPGGNLGNSSAFGKALYELYDHGLIPKLPRLAVVNSSGAPTLSRLVNRFGLKWNGGRVDDDAIAAYYSELDARGEKARTLASAIEINRPVNLKKCLRALERTNGVVVEASDQEILDAKAWIARDGLGCEPASAASLAGARILVERGIMDRDSLVVAVLTGHQLKDPHATVAYHSYPEDKLRSDFGGFGVTASPFANRPIPVANSLGEIIDVIRRTAREG
ncbi:MAG: pyridoxal-phosphate dependent enzyme [Planctomycetota bacterium]|jgi:threonine synthase|nr:pyridoxal-phosphate dependent enzyme [Planctomycetota bacterium]